jgi:hypothetical protein
MSSVTVFTALLGNGFQQCRALGFRVQRFLSSLAGTFQARSVNRLVKMLLDFASTVIPGFSLLEIHDEEFCVALSFTKGGGGRFFCVSAVFVAP